MVTGAEQGVVSEQARETAEFFDQRTAELAAPGLRSLRLPSGGKVAAEVRELVAHYGEPTGEVFGHDVVVHYGGTDDIWRHTYSKDEHGVITREAVEYTHVGGNEYEADLENTEIRQATRFELENLFRMIEEAPFMETPEVSQSRGRIAGFLAKLFTRS
jgi:hypothetical protein